MIKVWRLFFSQNTFKAIQLFAKSIKWHLARKKESGKFVMVVTCNIPSSELIPHSTVTIIKRVQECSQWACPICIMCSCIICTGRTGLRVHTTAKPLFYNCLWWVDTRVFISLICTPHALVGDRALVSRTNTRWLNITTLGLSSFFLSTCSVWIRPVL